MDKTPYRTGSACVACGKRVLWREGWGWLHALDDESVLVVWPHKDQSGHDPQGSWGLDENQPSQK